MQKQIETINEEAAEAIEALETLRNNHDKQQELINEQIRQIEQLNTRVGKAEKRLDSKAWLNDVRDLQIRVVSLESNRPMVKRAEFDEDSFRLQISPTANTDDVCEQGNKVLASVPVGAYEATIFWNMLRPLDLTLLKKFWVLADPDDKNIDLEKVHISEWVDNDDHKCIGMKDVETGLEQGVVRVVKAGGWVSERTCRNGRIHGLNRQVSKDSVRVMLYRDGNEIAYFCFGRNHGETERGGPHAHLLAPIKPEMFINAAKMR